MTLLSGVEASVKGWEGGNSSWKDGGEDAPSSQMVGIFRTKGVLRGKEAAEGVARSVTRGGQTTAGKLSPHVTVRLWKTLSPSSRSNLF